MKAEIKRQIKDVEAGNKIESWTLDWNEDTQTLSKMRSKETEADYRYFKEPDLLAVKLTEERIKELVESLPELPDAKKEKFHHDYGLPSYDSNILTSTIGISNLFESTGVLYDGNKKDVSNWILNDILSLSNELSIPPELIISPENFARILYLVDNGKINRSTGSSLIRKGYESKLDPDTIIEKEGSEQVTDSAEIESICQDVIQGNPSQVEQYKSGKGGVIGWLIGQVMAKSGGKADPQLVRETLEKLLK
jgi:aspartyl-tRNA(Asn)/glutamyl-tRNA(Gln) amidotransferase subunit B